MFDLPDHPIIRNMENTGYPDGQEPKEPHCPVCGAICESIYTYDRTEVVGCDNCVTIRDAYDVAACFDQLDPEEDEDI